jgi:hypothetical protein
MGRQYAAAERAVAFVQNKGDLQQSPLAHLTFAALARSPVRETARR